MNCIRHQQVVAVSQCVECGAGMCSDCVNASEYKRDGKPFCRDCNFNLINNLFADDSIAKKWLLVKLIANALFIIIGTIVFIDGGDAIASLFIVSLGGIPTAWKLFSTSDKDKAENKFDDAVADIKYGEGSGLMNSVIRFVMRVVLTVVIGAIAAPILLIVNIVKFVKCDKRIKEYEYAMANFANV
jgi:hypothetical protein